MRVSDKISVRFNGDRVHIARLKYAGKRRVVDVSEELLKSAQRKRELLNRGEGVYDYPGWHIETSIFQDATYLCFISEDFYGFRMP